MDRRSKFTKEEKEQAIYEALMQNDEELLYSLLKIALF